MEATAAGLPWRIGMLTKCLRDSWGKGKNRIELDSGANVARFDVYDGPAATSESTIHFFQMQKFGCVVELSLPLKVEHQR